MSKRHKRIIWFSRHKPLPSQIRELRRIFGENVSIIEDPKPFSNAENIIKRFNHQLGDEMVVVAPMSVTGKLCELGLKPLWAEMELTTLDKAEIVANGRGFIFKGFKRVKRLVLEFEEV